MQLLSLLQEFTSQFEQWSNCASLISLRKLIKAYFQSQLRANPLYCLCLLVNWPERKALALETLKYA